LNKYIDCLEQNINVDEKKSDHMKQTEYMKRRKANEVRKENKNNRRRNEEKNNRGRN
jgi:hypothetical protein